VKDARAYQLNGDDVVIARMVKARGIRGELACELATDFPERFQQIEDTTVVMPGGARLGLKLENHWFHKDRVILKFAGYDTMNDAERLVGGVLVISEADALELEEDEFYEYQLVGLEAVTAEGKRIGQVTGLLHTGGNELLVVEGEDKREVLIPFVEEICKAVDLNARRMIINPPQGLLDL
jgi:16S rRNA processing protein RimM